MAKNKTKIFLGIFLIIFAFLLWNSFHIPQSEIDECRNETNKGITEKIKKNLEKNNALIVKYRLFDFNIEDLKNSKDDNINWTYKITSKKSDVQLFGMIECKRMRVDYSIISLEDE